MIRLTQLSQHALRHTLPALAGAAAIAAGTLAGIGSAKADDTLIVGSTNFPEQLILANMYEDILEARGIVEVETRLNLGSREIVFPALRKGEIEALPEYTGALLSYVTSGETHARKPEEVLTQLRERLPEGIVALEPSPAQDKDALVIRAETAEKYNLTTVSDLADVAGELIIGGPPEMKTRNAGLPGLKDVYGIEFQEFRSLDAGGPLTKNALQNGDIDVARMFTTQGAIDENGWVTLEDDKNLIPAQNLVPVIRADATSPEIEAALNELSAALSTKALTKLNAKVSIDKMDPEMVAEEWLKAQGLI
ncbi:ABC transporter substrate-binding protein [Rhodovibrio salinarum]|uniref:Quaternary ammonium transporter n=1 Tax=Rhodovibrio salinarum TaxID=1087 RepID=A0A934QFT5_9PROT|nr:ABC transporter substrate-binding protein [Rhodovibrio salinarum]MBK1696196.1 quaternary ammonium transporter [Rhodovibrio salinarum]